MSKKDDIKSLERRVKNLEHELYGQTHGPDFFMGLPETPTTASAITAILNHLGIKLVVEPKKIVAVDVKSETKTDKKSPKKS